MTSESGWRTVAGVLAICVAALVWRDCARSGRTGLEREPRAAAAADCARESRDERGWGDERRGDDYPDDYSDDGADDAEGPSVEAELWRLASRHWLVRFLTPKPGESLLDYRDRVVPAAQLALAPIRSRVADARDRFAAEAELSPDQSAALDSAVDGAAEAIQDRVLQAVLSGELSPARATPTRGVALARDVLDLAAGAAEQFSAALAPDQRDALDADSFDVVEYLLFHTRWEDALGVID